MRIRAIAAIGLATTALLTVSACRVEQGAAVFVGHERITEKRVDELVDSIPDPNREELAQLANLSTGGLRGYIIDALTTVELGKRVVADTGAKPDGKAGEAVGLSWEQVNLDGDSAFVELAVEAGKYRPVLFEGSKPAKPEKDEIDENTAQFERLQSEDLNDSEREQLRGLMTEWLNSEPGQEAVGKQRQVNDYLAEYEVQANPRYGQTTILISPGNGQLQQPPVFADIPTD